MTVQDGFFLGIGFMGAVLILVALIAIVYLAVSFSSYMKEKKASEKDAKSLTIPKNLP